MTAAPGSGGPPVRLLMVTHSLSGGGAERFVATLAGALDRGRFVPAVAAATALRSYPVPADLAVAELGYRGPASLPGTIFRLRRLVEARAPDVVLSNVLSTNCLTGAALAGLRRRPAWIARVGNAPEEGDPFFQRLWARRVYPRADLLVANSRGLRDALMRVYPGVAARCRSLPNPVDFGRLERLAAEPLPPEIGSGPDGAVRVLWVGRLTRQKRPELALEALARARRELGPQRPLRLWMCGRGPLESGLARRIGELGLGDAVVLAGFLNNPFPLVRAADLFLATSDFEGLPNALIEAQGLGLAAVATRCPHGPDEVVDHGSTGLLVPPGSAGALARALAELAADPERRRAMGRAAEARSRERFALEGVLPRWQAALQEAASVAVSRRLR